MTARQRVGGAWRALAVALALGSASQAAVSRAAAPSEPTASDASAAVPGPAAPAASSGSGAGADGRSPAPGDDGPAAASTDGPRAGAEDYVRIRLSPGGPTPFDSIAYEVTWRGPATTAVHRRTLPGDAESLHSLGLLTRDEALAVGALLRGVDVLSLGDGAPESASPWDLTWTVDVQLEGVSRTFRVTAPEQLRDRRYFRLVDGVRRAVKAVTGELPFRNVFFSPDRRGWVTLQSVPAARVWIDGFDTQLETPLYSYELAAGAHTIRLVAASADLDRTYEIKVEPGGTTNLRVDLR